MRIGFVLRADAVEKPGGDTSKVRRYIEILADHGIRGAIERSVDAAADAGASAIHLLNLDLPLENLRHAEMARAKGLPVFLSTIRHPWDGMEAMYRSGDDRYYQRLRGLGLSAQTGVLLRERLKLARRGNLKALHIRKFHDAQRRLVEAVDCLLPMARGEADALLRDFGPSLPLSYVPNGFNSFPAEARPSSFEFDLVSVGRVEPRKNTLALVRAARSLGLSILVIGSVNDRHQGYGEAVRELVRSMPGSQFLGAVPQTQLMSLLQSARTYVNAAWFEVVSQADVEAAAVGLPVVSTRHSYLRDFLDLGEHSLDPEILASPAGPEHLATVLDAVRSPVLGDLPTWQDAVGKLVDAYARLGGGQ